MQYKSILLLSIPCLVFAGGCGEKKEDEASSSVDSVESTIESGVTAMDGVIDEQVNSIGFSLRAQENRSIAEWVNSVLFPLAHATTCTRARAATCSAGVQTVTYDSCTGPLDLITASGDVTLTYSSANCTMTSTGDSVSRTYDLTLNGPRSGVLTLTSENTAPYDTNVAAFGGGGKLTKTSSGYSLEILGKHKSFSSRGTERFNVSMKTSSAVTVTGGLTRASRTVNGGELIVYHNLARFTATIQPVNLTYTSASCHPATGSLNVTFAGNVTGTATVTFNGDGSATVDHGGTVSTFTLSYCE